MASGTPCLNSRWDQPVSKTDMLQGFMGNVSHSLTSSASTGALGSNPVVTTPPAPTVAMTASPPYVPGSVQPPASNQQSSGGDAPQGGVEMAAAMAAKLNAMLMAKGKLKPLQPLPAKVPPCLPVTSSTDELVVTEVDINDVPINCRNLLTKGKTQEEIRQCSGAIVSTKGLYMTTNERSSVQGVERPLYLHVQGRSQEEVNKAVLRIKEIISEEVLRSSGGQAPPVMPTLPVYPQPPRSAAPPQPLRPHMPPGPRLPNNLHSGSTGSQSQRPSGPHGHSGNFVHTKIFVGLEQALPSFKVKEKVEGPSSSYLQHIQTETGARVFLRGKGSGYIEQASRRESFEPLYIYISHPNSTGLESAKKLCESLLETVRAEHSTMVSVYTATGSTQAYPAQGFPANSNYTSQGSWYNYPANGYTGGYTAYPGASGYWSSANGPPSQSNISTTPQSSQAMVQYPVCPRKPPPYLVQDQDSHADATEDGSSTSPSRSTSPKRRFIEDCEEGEEKQAESSEDVPVKEHQLSPPADRADEPSSTESALMPPPAAPVVSATRKRPREPEVPEIPDEEPPSSGKVQAETTKKPKLLEDSLGLVPYGGDSSDEEEERMRSCKKSNL